MLFLLSIGSNMILAFMTALAALIAQRGLKRPGVAHILWVLALIKLITPPPATVSLGRPPGSTACVLGLCGCEHHARAITFLRDLAPSILAVVWSTGAVMTAWVAWSRRARFQRLIAHADAAPAEWRSLAERIAAELSLRRPPKILVVSSYITPLVIPGLYRPRMLLPSALLDELTASQREALILHELVHIKRGDHLVRMIELAVSVAYWWLPIVSVIGRELRACEETCCDAAVVARLPESRRDYARMLLDVIDFTDRSPAPAAEFGAAISHADHLDTRLRAILDDTHASGRTSRAFMIAAGLACVLSTCQLRFNLVDRSKSATTSVKLELATNGSKSYRDQCETKTSSLVLCCPRTPDERRSP